MTKQKKPTTPQEYMPSAEEVQAELAKVQSMDDFFGKKGVFAKLFASTLEQMLEGELTEHLGYEPYEAAGCNSGNNRNGHYPKKVRTSTGETTVQVRVTATANSNRRSSHATLITPTSWKRRYWPCTPEGCQPVTSPGRWLS